MRVLFLTVAPIGSVADSGVYTDLLREFRDRGDEVYVVSPADRRYGLAPGLAVEDGISVLRISTGVVTRVRSAVQKGVSTLMAEYQFISGIRRHFSGQKFDLVLYTAPPVTMDRVVRFVKSHRPCASYLLLKDIFPQNAVDLGLMRSGGLLFRYFRYRERRLYEVSDYIGCMSAANVDYVRRNNTEIDAARVEVCPNGIQPAPLMQRGRYSRELRDKYDIPSKALLLVYGGNLGVPQGIGFLLDILDACRSRDDLFFMIVGSGTEYSRIENHLNSGGHTNVRLASSMPRREFTELLADADVGLVLLDGRFTIPNFPSRLTAYLEAGIPVISGTDAYTDLPHVLEASGCGVGVPAGDVEAFVRAVDILRLNPAGRLEMGARGRHLLETEYTVARCYEIITAHRPSSGDSAYPADAPIRDMSPVDIDDVVALHMSAMRSFFLTSLGRRFLNCYYARLIVDDSALAKVWLTSEGSIAGFVVGSTNPAGFYRRLLINRWWEFALAALPAVLRTPSVALRLLRALRFPGGQPEGDSLAGLYSIAVDPLKHGRGIGGALVSEFLVSARACGSSAVYLHADAQGNDHWNALLQRSGWRLTRSFVTPEGREMNEYWFELCQGGV